MNPSQTTFNILWDFLKKSRKFTQEAFAGDIEVTPKTLRNWINNGFGRSRDIDAIFVCKTAFSKKEDITQYDEECVKNFLQYIALFEYFPEEEIFDRNQRFNAKKFESFFIRFLISDRNPPVPFMTVSKYRLPPFFCKREKNSDDHLGSAYSDPYDQVHVIYAEPGMGKTTYALNYANEVIKDRKFDYVFVVTYHNSIKQTISDLGNERIEYGVSVDLFERNLFRLRKICSTDQKSVLLIIDNYDNPKASSELTASNKEYIQLLETGCKILITTNLNLSKCYCIDDNKHITRLAPLPTRDLLSIFCKIRGQSTDKKNVCNLIDNYLLGNTYLTVLCAELANQGMEVNKIIDSIAHLKADNTKPFPIQKDGKRQDEKTLLEHFCCILDNNRIVNPDDDNEKQSVHKILVTLAMLPIGGVKEEYFEKAFGGLSKEDEKSMVRLKDHNIIFRNNGKIYMQPVVMEYVIRNHLIFNQIFDLLCTLNIYLDADILKSEMMDWVRISESVSKVLSDDNIKKQAKKRTIELKGNPSGGDIIKKTLDMSLVIDARISSCYTAIDIFDKGYEYAKRAFKKMNDIISREKIATNQKTELDKVTIANCCNIIGYAYLNNKSESLEKRLKIVDECIKYGEKLLSDTTEDEIRAMRVLSQLHGIKAGYYLRIKDYKSALNYHTLALEERETFKEKLGSNPIEKERMIRRISFMHRAIGTDHYYMAKEATTSDEKIRHLLKSYNSNLKAIDIYKEFEFDTNTIGTIGNYNRFSGSALELVSTINDDQLLKKTIGLTFDELSHIIFDYMRIAFEIYRDCGLNLNPEIQASLERLITLTQMISNRGLFNKKKANINHQAIGIVRNLKTVNDECNNLANDLEKLTNDLCK
ncbi:MAG: hypothetical protein IJB43_11300 [Clostridia bacterium]|nr:hypothetical protein [Clostridia bacterium]